MSEEDRPKRDIYELFGAEGSRPGTLYTRVDVEDNLEPVAGDKIVGTLGGNMPERFVEMTILEMELDDLQELLRERAVTRVAEHILEGKFDMNWIAENASALGLFISEREAEDFFEKQATYYKLHSDFWFNVRTLFNCWNDWLSIRHDFHVVSTGKKFVPR